ncbi:chaplin family protein [Streptomyces sudanensis]|uniref:chaplin family protein n=1 Tax=Streptomyces sudanensis TaxID=436397 RepID=UPI0020CB9706|nr:chaplin family protein [Streptomyces sudanensis]MCP9959394.1 DUF320 domain-containing protein [Streptomyces sudanensis]MCP9988471.1 DUF320 domain-containing protein [Streptomyces sudanensis]MCQ0000149.1 DUF320 domain-containing protein [Streptomyces sudanensis]
MRHIRRNGLVALMITSGALALAAGSAQADTDPFAAAFDSVGTVAGDEALSSADGPAGVCGGTVDAEGLLGPAAGGICEGEDEKHVSHGEGTATTTLRGAERHVGQGGATALAAVIGSSGATSDGGVPLPADLPVKVVGDAVSIVAVEEPAFDDSDEPSAQDVAPPKPATPPTSDEPAAPAPMEEAPAQAPSLAATGAGDLAGMGLPAAGLVLAGALLYRRSRSAAARA